MKELWVFYFLFYHVIVMKQIYVLKVSGLENDYYGYFTTKAKAIKAMKEWIKSIRGSKYSKSKGMRQSVGPNYYSPSKLVKTDEHKVGGTWWELAVPEIQEEALQFHIEANKLDITDGLFYN